MSGGRWQPSAYRAGRHPSRPLHVVDGSPSGPSSEATDWEVRSPMPGRANGCIWWLLLAAVLALPAGVLAAALAHQAFR